MVQRLGAGAFTARAWVQSLVRELRPLKGYDMVNRKKKFSSKNRVSSRIFYTSSYLAQLMKQSKYQQNMAFESLGGDIDLWSEKAMASHFSTLAWKIPWMEEPGRLQSMGSLRVERD